MLKWLDDFWHGNNQILTIISLVPLFLLVANWLLEAAEAFELQPLPFSFIRNRQRGTSGEPESHERLLDEIREYPFFRQIDPSLRAELLAESEFIELPKGVYVCRQGGSERDLFVVISGYLSIYRNYDKHRREWVTQIGPKALFGEGGFFLNQPRTADVVTDQRVMLLNSLYPRTCANSAGGRARPSSSRTNLEFTGPGIQPNL